MDYSDAMKKQKKIGNGRSKQINRERLMDRKKPPLMTLKSEKDKNGSTTIVEQVFHCQW